MKNIILLPTYNEKENVKIIIPEIFNLYPDVRVLVIDDNSPDKTSEVVKELMQKYPNLSILERPKKTGLGDAYKEAIKKVRVNKEINLVITMDADGSHSPEYLRDFFVNNNSFDLIIGSRYVKNGGVESWELWRKYLSRFGNLYTKALTGLKINDFTAGFMCIKRELLEKVNLNEISSSGYPFLIELKFFLINNFKAKTKEIPIIFKSRREGESKLSNQTIGDGIKTAPRLFLKRLWPRK